MHLARVDFPEPDSPTTPRVSPSFNSKLICETLEELIYEDPTEFGFEYEDEAEEILHYQELMRDDR